MRKSEISSPRKTIKQVNHKRFTFPLLYDNTSHELSCEYIRVLLKTYAVLSFSSLHSCSTLLPLPPPRDQCSYANWGFLFRRTVEPTFQNKSALKCHTYFMDLKCSKSKSVLDGGARRSFYDKAGAKKKTWCSMTSFRYWRGLIAFERVNSRLWTCLRCQ